MQIHKIFMTLALRLVVSISLFMAACNSSTIDDAIDAIEDVPRKSINTDILGTNAFVNDGRFGSMSQQFAEVKNTIRLNSVRLLFNWNNGIQSTPGREPNFSFYDDIVDSLPSGMDAIVVLNGVPSWMSNSSNWINSNPRTTFVELWVKKVVARYANNPRIIGWQIWNEPNMTANSENVLLGMAGSPANYVEMLRASYNAIRSIAPADLVISAATTSINQNFPQTLDYNRGMNDAGATSVCDVYAIHYYGKQFENVKRSSGAGDFLNELNKEIWVTESGEQGVTKQLDYGRQVWPFLVDEIPNVKRIYQYQFVESSDASVTYGLRNLTPGAILSDLYIFLRDR